jgi:hypothetical protein
VSALAAAATESLMAAVSGACTGGVVAAGAAAVASGPRWQPPAAIPAITAIMPRYRAVRGNLNIVMGSPGVEYGQ